MALSKAVLKLAAALARSAEQDYAEYAESCESWRREGYRPHYCEHGTNLWTDYDNICGPCEDGLTMRDPMQRREWALDSAKRRDASAKAIVKAASDLRDLGVDVDWTPVWKRVMQLITVE